MKYFFLLLFFLSIKANSAQLYVIGDFHGKDSVAVEIKDQLFYSGFLNQKICMPFALKMHIDTSKAKELFIIFTVVSGGKVKINQYFRSKANNENNIYIEYDGVRAKLKIDTEPPKEKFFCDFFNKVTRS